MIAMSGGVDSSVAALLTQREGYECTGAMMRLFSNEEIGIEGESRCCSLDDAEDARSVAHRIGMPFFVFNFSDKFRDCVIEKFVRTYKRGATPNPCIDCNRFLKFERFFLRAQEMGIDHIVTGHYASVYYDDVSHRWGLRKGIDDSKDQSYVLYALTQEQLAHTLLPLGTMTKKEVRAIAEENKFINARKRESQDICFVPDGDYAAFIERYTGEPLAAGNFVDTHGNVIGRHRGFVRYTIGQRRGLGLSLREPLYVCAKRAQDNTVVLGKSNELFSKSLTASDINLITCEKITSPIHVKAKTRYRQREAWATVEQIGDSRIRVEFDEPMRAITSGQAVVLYDGDIVVGGGTID